MDVDSVKDVRCYKYGMTTWGVARVVRPEENSLDGELIHKEIESMRGNERWNRMGGGRHAIYSKLER